jgi:hypothetical protein
VGKYFLNNCRIFDTGNDPDITTAFTTGFYLNTKYTLQSLCPRHRSSFFGRRLVGLIG